MTIRREAEQCFSAETHRQWYDPSTSCAYQSLKGQVSPLHPNYWPQKSCMKQSFCSLKCRHTSIPVTSLKMRRTLNKVPINWSGFKVVFISTLLHYSSEIYNVLPAPSGILHINIPITGRTLLNPWHWLPFFSPVLQLKLLHFDETFQAKVRIYTQILHTNHTISTSSLNLNRFEGQH